MVTTARELEQHLGKGTRTIGALVYWRHLMDAKIPRTTLEEGFTAAGLAPAVPHPKVEKMLTDAVTRARAGRGQEVKIDLKAKGQKSVYRIMMRRDSDRARYVEEARVAIDRYAPNAQLETELLEGVQADQTRDDVIEDIRDNLAEIRAYAFPNEISDALVSAMEHLHALPLRTGVYFVHADALTCVGELAAFIAKNTPAALTVWEMRDTAQNALTARADARASFLDRLDELKAKVAAFTAETAVEDASPRGVSTRVAYFHDLDADVGMWADVLGGAADELRKSIADAKQALLGNYLGLLDNKASDDAQNTEVAQDAA
jgi:hypothetical protein